MDLFRYIPDESLGSLFSGNTNINLNQTVNPEPSLTNYVTGLIQSGGEESALSVLLTSPQYFRKAAYYRGFYRSRNIRN